MPAAQDYYLARYEDGVIQWGMSPPSPITGQSLQFQIMNRFGGISGLITKSTASGYTSGQSGISIINPLAGSMNININSQDTSGWDCKVYSYTVQRMDSGFRTLLSEGFLILTPNVG